MPGGHGKPWVIPTTGEWTADDETVVNSGNWNFWIGDPIVAKRIADAHNAELAAERDSREAYRDLWHGQQQTTSKHLETILQLRSQLAAEKEITAAVAKAVEPYKASIGALELSNEGKRQEFHDLYDSVIELMPQEFRQNSKGAVDCLRRFVKSYYSLAQENHEYRHGHKLAAAQQPLADALITLRQKARDSHTVSSSVIMFIIADALAKVKEGK
jgi:hypothetical protein